MPKSVANAGQIDFWNSAAGEHWVSSQETMDRTLSVFGQLAIDALAINEASRVLDVGCGCGDTTLVLAKTGAQVTGVDISAPMLARANSRKDQLQDENIEFLQADAASHRFPEQYFDAVYSRFGVMFFDDPVSAFLNIRRSMKAGAKLSFVCWQPAAQNQWMRVPVSAALAHIEAPPTPSAGTPGPFAFGDEQHTRSLLTAAGFADISLLPENKPMRFLINPRQTLGQQFAEMGPLGRLLQTAPNTLKQQVIDSITAVLQDFIEGDYVVMDGAVWRVAASN